MRRYLSRRFENRLFGPIRGLMLRRFDAKRQHRETLFEPRAYPARFSQQTATSFDFVETELLKPFHGRNDRSRCVKRLGDFGGNGRFSAMRRTRAAGEFANANDGDRRTAQEIFER
jgi:hypothetical protein